MAQGKLTGKPNWPTQRSGQAKLAGFASPPARLKQLQTALYYARRNRLERQAAQTEDDNGAGG